MNSSKSQMLHAYSQPLRSISTGTYAVLSQFPIVSQAALDEAGSRIRRDLRANTSCSLLEWDSLIQYVSVERNQSVRHEPKYNARDVPRYDVDEMTMHFATLRGLLGIFRHFTTRNIRRLIVKEKFRRKRRNRAGSKSFSPSARQLVQVIGDIISSNQTFKFSIGSVFQPGSRLSPGFRYPVLFRPSNA